MSAKRETPFISLVLPFMILAVGCSGETEQTTTSSPEDVLEDTYEAGIPENDVEPVEEIPWESNAILDDLVSLNPQCVSAEDPDTVAMTLLLYGATDRDEILVTLNEEEPLIADSNNRFTPPARPGQPGPVDVTATVNNMSETLSNGLHFYLEGENILPEYDGRANAVNLSGQIRKIWPLFNDDDTPVLLIEEEEGQPVYAHLVTPDGNNYTSIGSVSLTETGQPICHYSTSCAVFLENSSGHWLLYSVRDMETEEILIVAVEVFSDDLGTPDVLGTYSADTTLLDLSGSALNETGSPEAFVMTLEQSSPPSADIFVDVIPLSGETGSSSHLTSVSPDLDFATLQNSPTRLQFVPAAHDSSYVYQEASPWLAALVSQPDESLHIEIGPLSHWLDGETPSALTPAEDLLLADDDRLFGAQLLDLDGDSLYDLIYSGYTSNGSTLEMAMGIGDSAEGPDNIEAFSSPEPLISDHHHSPLQWVEQVAYFDGETDPDSVLLPYMSAYDGGDRPLLLRFSVGAVLEGEEDIGNAMPAWGLSHINDSWSEPNDALATGIIAATSEDTALVATGKHLFEIETDRSGEPFDDNFFSAPRALIQTEAIAYDDTLLLVATTSGVVSLLEADDAEGESQRITESPVEAYLVTYSSGEEPETEAIALLEEHPIQGQMHLLFYPDTDDWVAIFPTVETSFSYQVCRPDCVLMSPPEAVTCSDELQFSDQTPPRPTTEYRELEYFDTMLYVCEDDAGDLHVGNQDLATSDLASFELIPTGLLEKAQLDFSPDAVLERWQLLDFDGGTPEAVAFYRDPASDAIFTLVYLTQGETSYSVTWPGDMSWRPVAIGNFINTGLNSVLADTIDETGQVSEVSFLTLNQAGRFYWWQPSADGLFGTPLSALDGMQADIASILIGDTNGDGLDDLLFLENSTDMAWGAAFHNGNGSQLEGQSLPERLSPGLMGFLSMKGPVSNSPYRSGFIYFDGIELLESAP